MSTKKDEKKEVNEEIKRNKNCNDDLTKGLDEHCSSMIKQTDDNKLPNGDNLKAMRIATGMSLDEARIRANKIAAELKSDISFSERAMRRFENIGINETYGKTPPSYAELNILMRTYNGSPGFLLINIDPPVFPWKHFDKHKTIFFTNNMVDLMNDVAGQSQAHQKVFFDFYHTFIKQPKSE